MGATKTQLFTTEQNELAALARTLGHPARIAILEILASRKACICNDIVDEVGLAQPTISQHLRELKQTGLIKGDIEGASVCYCLDHEALGRLNARIGRFLGALRDGGGCC